MTDPTRIEPSTATAAPASREQIADGYRRLRAGESGQAILPCDVITVDGPDAVTYLQGQLSQDIVAMAPGTSVPSFLLDPSGKLGWWIRVTRTGETSFLLDLDAGFGPGALARLQRFKLRTKATIELLPGWRVVAADRRDDESDAPPPTLVAVVADAGATAEPDDRGEAAAAGAAGHLDARTPVLVRACWPGAQGWDVLLPPGMALDLPVVAAEALEAIRIEAGVPRLGAELVADQTIPGEVGPWAIAASVSFTKGCYTGQELVARIDSRGNNVPRPIRGLRIEAAGGDGAAGTDPTGSAPLPVGAEIVVDGTVVGQVTSIAWSPVADSFVALAPIGRTIEPPVAAVVTWDGGEAPATVEALPLRG